MTTAIVEGMLAGLENIWGCWDELLDTLKTPEDWAQAHGDQWTLADAPYHMMYTDRDLVAAALLRGPNVPESEQRVQRTLGDLNEWNTSKFAHRPQGQTPDQSVMEWRAARADVRRAFQALHDEDLQSKTVWFPLAGCGWVPASFAAGFGLAHNWSEFMQLRYHMARTAPEPDATATHGALGFLQGYFPIYMDAKAANGVRFTLLLEYPGLGGGAWTIRVADGTASLTEERVARPDLTITQDPETFELIRQGKLNPGAAMRNGRLQIKPIHRVGTFGALFGPPPLDKQFEPMGAHGLG